MGSFLSKPYVSDPSVFATKGDNTDAETSDEAQQAYKTYDYIIVGAGAAGCVLANRLSEDPNISVLLVEAGESHEGITFSQIPIAFGKLFKTSSDWEYYTTPQPELYNRELFHPRGKLLGGCTSINAMMYHHCSPSDFDEWEHLGAKGWGYKDLLPYFRKSEKYTPHVLHPDVRPEDRGDSGLWQTSYSHFAPPCDNFLEAAQALGIPYNPDINTSRGSLGVAKIATFIDSTGCRSSTATAYLGANVKARKNLTIAVGTLTTRVLFSSDESPRAIGIEVAKNASSPRYYVAVRKEVILSAGSLATPQILNLSGIGASDELEKFDIKVVKNLQAVGKNLRDHLASGAITFRAKKGTSIDFMSHPVWSLPPIMQWLVTGKGPASSNVAEVAAFVRSTDPTLPFGSRASKLSEVDDATSGPDAPDLELLAAPIAFLKHGFERLPPGTECFTIYPTLLRPLSKGRVYISSSSPFDKAIVDPNYLSHPNDLKVLARGVRLALRIGRAEPLQGVLQLKEHSENKKDVFWPGNADPDLITDEEVEDRNEDDSVVNSELKVHGVRGLRVIDASIFPSQLSGHPTATLVAIAEKASEMILKD